MSDIGFNLGVTGWILIALLLAWPGLLAGAAAGLLWRQHRVAGALTGAVLGFAGCLGAFYLWKTSDWG